MGFSFTFGRITLGLLMIVQAVSLYQSGFKEQTQQLKDLRVLCIKERGN